MATEQAGSVARSSFLKSAAHFYSVSALSTSAHLMLQYAEFATTSKDTRSGKPDGSVCTVCGTTSIPGWTSSTTLGNYLSSSRPATRSKIQKSKLSEKDEDTRIKCFTTQCLICRRYTKQTFQPNTDRKASHAKKIKMEKSSLMLGTVSTTSDGGSQQYVTQNFSSRKRAKGRKQGGLQAMLEKFKAANQPPPGSTLDLMDLMKKT